MNVWLLVLGVTLLFFPAGPSYAIEEDYLLEINTHYYNISYSLDGNLIAMAIDNELNSLLIGIENVSESIFEITLPDEMIYAENNEFAVLVNGLEVDYNLIPLSSGVKMQFLIPDNTEEIEIIGTHVIPEFPLAILISMPILFVLLIVLTKKNTIR
jgi:hypothetical protein